MISGAGPDAFVDGNLADPGISESDSGPAASRQHHKSSFEENLNPEADDVGDRIAPSDVISTESADPGIFNSSPSDLAIAQPEQSVVNDQPAPILELINTAAQTGIEAEGAFEQLINTEDDSSAAIEFIVESHATHGSDGISMLGFIAGFPDKPELLAIDRLQQLAQLSDPIGGQASSELLMLANDNIAGAKDAIRTLLLDANETTVDAIVLHADSFGDGMNGVLNAMADLGDPGLNALILLAESGFDFARDGLGPVAGAIENSEAYSSF